jgi:1,4-dihydroxy-2-naphthoyl-CoA hydrolase
VIDPKFLNDRMKGTFAASLGIRVLEATKDKIVAELDHRPDLTTIGGGMHGGALMAFADTVGAWGAFLNLPQGAGTTTLESKTNFFAACRGGKVKAVVEPLHRGRRSSVWQTRLYDEEGRMLTQTVQTQMVLEGKA